MLWLSEGGERMPPRLHVAPLEVCGPMRDKLLGDKTVVFTSATLRLGGDFAAVATSVGLKPDERGVRCDRGGSVESGTGSGRLARARRRVAVRLRQAGDPLRRQAPARRRAATGSARRSSTRSPSSSTPPRAAPSACSPRAAPPRPRPRSIRERLPHLTTLAQGEAQLPELARQFVERPAHLPVRHLEPVAGPRRPRRDLPARDHRSDPVPSARRPADVGTPTGRRPGRAATASCKWRPRTRPCCWPRAPGG